MTFKELPFKEPLRSDFELIATRVFTKFPCARFYTNIEDGLSDTMPDFIISGVSKENIKAIDLSDLRTPYCVEEEDIMKGGFYIHTCEMNDVTILDTGAVEVTML